MKHTTKQSVTMINRIPVLQSEPQSFSPQLIVAYQPFIRKIIAGFARKSHITGEEIMDYLQLVNEKLLIKLQSGQLQKYSITHSWKALLATIVKNIVKNELRAQSLRKMQTLDKVPTHLQPKAYSELPSSLQWENATRKLQRILRLFRPKDRAKLEVCLKTLYHIPLTISQLQELYPLAKAYTLRQAIGLLNKKDRINISKAELWKYLNQALQLLEGNKSKVDALRKWYAKRYQVILHNLFKNTSQMDKAKKDRCFEHLLHYFYKA